MKALSLKIILLSFAIIFIRFWENRKVKNPVQEQLRQFIKQNQYKGHYENRIPKDSFLFIETRKGIYGRVIRYKSKSKIISVPVKMIDSPHYYFDDSLKLINTHTNSFEPESANYKVLLGYSNWLSYLIGGGAYSNLKEMNFLPQRVESTTICMVDSSLCVYLKYENKFYKVPKGETVMDSVISFKDVNDILGGRIRVTTEYKFINHGLLPVSAIKYD
jgi:hypothetical protein